MDHYTSIKDSGLAITWSRVESCVCERQPDQEVAHLVWLQRQAKEREERDSWSQIGLSRNKDTWSFMLDKKNSPEDCRIIFFFSFRPVSAQLIWFCSISLLQCIWFDLKNHFYLQIPLDNKYYDAIKFWADFRNDVSHQKHLKLSGPEDAFSHVFEYS